MVLELSNNFTRGKILAPLLRFSGPIFLAMFLQAMYGAVDLLIVGQFGDKTGVSAVSTGSQIIMTVTGFVTSLTMGVTILLGQKLGQKSDEDSGNVVGASILFFAALGVVLSLAIAAAARPLSALMQAPPEAFEDTARYVAICAAGSIFIVAYNTVSAVFRGMGNSRAPLMVVAAACAVHIAAALLLVGAFRLGASGAAVATVFSEAVSVFLALIIIKKKGLPFPFGRRHIRFHGASVRTVLKFGSPIALQDLLTNISFLVIIAIVNSLGLVASAGAGIGEKVCVFMMLIPAAFMSSLSAFVAQNVGASLPLRAKKALYYGAGTSVIAGLLMFVLAFWDGKMLAGIFSNDPAVVAASAEYLKGYAIDCPLVAALFCMIGYCNGNGKTLFTMLQGVFCAFAVRIPIAYMMSRLPDVTLFKVGLATPTATAAGILIFLIYLKLAKWNKTSPAAQTQAL
jgi:putative MATE family efflux protein